ncbi:MAG: BON domain-containing protein [Bdellovibrio sp.]|nr:BON domain-containing protein [Bdellovibrio sp.]
MFNLFGKSDAEVKQDVINELMWDPSVNSSEVKVIASKGIVTLSGSVPHYIEKRAAEQATQRVGGVRAVADELQVKSIFDKTDEDIAVAALEALANSHMVPEHLRVAVEKGWITLSGEADWHYQRAAAMDAVSKLLGVSGVTNGITIKERIQSADVKTLIEQALKRTAEEEGKNILVSVQGNKITLSGTVHSFAESDVARHAAWNAPGVMNVENNLKIFQ